MDPITGYIVSALLGVALQLAGSLAQQAFGPKPDATRMVRRFRGQYSSGATAPLRIVLGTYGVPGHLDYSNAWGFATGTPNSHNVDVLSLSDLPITGVTAAWVDSQPITLAGTGHVGQGYPVPEYKPGSIDYLWYEFRDGTHSTVSSYLTNRFGSDPDRPWESDMIGEGIAQALMTARINDTLWTGFPSYMFALQGLPVYDPRKDTTAGGSGAHRFGTFSTYAFSDNPVVLIYNILRGLHDADGNYIWGGRATAYQLPYDVWAAAMDACDATVNLKAGGTEKRYRAGIDFGVNERPTDVIRELLVACNGRQAYHQGQYFILIDVPAASDFSITDADLLASEEIGGNLLPDLDSLVNGATATFMAPGRAWESKETAPYYRSDLEAEDDDQRLLASLTLRSVFSGTQAQRILKGVVQEGRRFRRHILPLPPQYGQYRPLKALDWTSDEFQYDEKLFLILGKTEDQWANIFLVVLEIEPTDVSEWDEETDETDIVYAPLTPQLPTVQAADDFDAAGTVLLDNDGENRIAGIQITVAGDLDDVRATHVQVVLAGASIADFDDEVKYDPDVTEFPLPMAFVGATAYEVRGRYVPRDGSGRLTGWSDWIPVTTPGVLPVPPNSITNEELAKKWRDAIEWVVSDGPAALEARILAALDRLAGSVTTNTMASDRDRRAVSAEVGTVQAAVVNEISARADADSALSQSILEVAAQAASGLAEGLFTVRAEAAPDGVEVRLSMLARVTTLEDYVDTGILIDLRPDGGGGYVSEILLKADSVYMTDGDVNALPFAFTDGVLTLAVANIGTVLGGMLRNAPGTTFLNLNTGGFRLSSS